VKKILFAICLVFLLSACSAKDGGTGFISEDKYEGDELDIVRLINQRIKYVQEGNESKYMELFYEESPINGLPRYKLQKVKLTSDIEICEQRRFYIAVVQAEDIMETGEMFNSQYVFLKPKETDEGWQIADID